MFSDLNPRSDPPLDFPLSAFGTLDAGDYDTLGFICGLEVHQQLLTASKLFCRCPAGQYSTRVDAEVLRRMRPTLSELGEYDGTALMEFKTKKEVVYLLERSTVCTYELDDTPPFPIDHEAVMIALEVARLFELNLVSELHVMRKQYLDGSIPTGFQRTAMVGLTGEIPFRDSVLGPDRRLRIRQLSLEEDSCREVSDVGHRIRFRTDRLGMPLTETVTEPDLLTPEDVRRGAALIARLTHATNRVRRGAGAARQDVNVSVAGGRRVELKGVPSHRALPRLVHTEAFRQLELLKLAAALADRGVTGMEGSRTVDATSLLSAASGPIGDAVWRGDAVGAVALPGFAGLLTRPTQPGRTFAHEIEDRVRVIACLTDRPFMAHSDSAVDALTSTQWAELRRALKATDDDAVVVLWGPGADVATGLLEVVARAADALVGVPSETRQANADGTNGFERILPGPDRMYPDTDTPPLPVRDAWIAEIHGRLGERIWDREDRYRALGLSEAAAWRLADAPYADVFDDVAPAAGAPARRLAHALEKARARGDRSLTSRLVIIARTLEGGGPIRHATDDLVRVAVAGTAPDLAAYAPAGDDELEAAITAMRRRLGEVRSREPAARLRWALGEILRPLRGRVEPEDVAASIEGTLS